MFYIVYCFTPPSGECCTVGGEGGGQESDLLRDSQYPPCPPDITVRGKEEERRADVTAGSEN